MGYDVNPRKVILGYCLGDLQCLWNSLKINGEEMVTEDLEMSELETSEIGDTFEFGLWKNFAITYEAKYAGLKNSGVSGFYGMETCTGYYEAGLDWYYFYVGIEIKNKLVTAQGLNIAIPERFPEIARDFVVFTVKYGKEYLKACYRKDIVMEYAIVPEEEAKELFAGSGVVIPEAVEVHQTLFGC